VTYALLQQSLDQTISRAEMEEASVAVPSVARADCAVLQRELFGIVVRGLERADALAFQAALRMRGFPTEVVADDELPELAEPLRGLGLRTEPDALVNTDLYRRDQRFVREESVFLAGGLVGPQDRSSRWEGAEEFRLELFIAHEPWRIQWLLGADSVWRVNGRAYQLRDRWQLGELLRELRDFLPAERVNRAIRDAGIAEPVTYPSARAFEEEIVWHFFHLTRPGAQP
jgi:hypothetical protein